jgi:hypothetical protein
MIFQLQYRFKVRPSAGLLALARAAFIKGIKLNGVTVTPIAWTGTVQDLRKALKERRAFIGEAGIVKQYADPFLTMCDYDGKWRPSIVRIMRVATMLRLKPRMIREDKTRRGWHILIEWNRRLSPLEQVAIQCVLGSDIQRETYNLARVMSGKQSPRWNLLFERKIT